MLVCAYNAQFGTRDRGCSAHPAFPAPSIFEGGKRICITRAKSRREIADAHSLPTSSRRKPGPIRRGGCCLKKLVDGFAKPTQARGYGSLLSQGRQGEPGRRPR